ncbi:MAG: hypothetical protein V1821_01290 [bacterium]
MDAIDELPAKLLSKQRAAFLETIELIQSGDLKGLDLLKLKDRDDIYRVRKGGFRVIFLMKSPDDIRIIAIERRSDTNLLAIFKPNPPPCTQEAITRVLVSSMSS